MGFLVKAATLALSVLASVFTNVEAPIAQAKPVPTMTQASFTPSPQQFHFECEKPGSIVIVKVFTPKPDPESERIMAWIRGEQAGSKPVARVPWYSRTNELELPTFDETAGLLEALLESGSDL